MNNLTGFQRDLLHLVAGLDDPNILTIKESLEEYYVKDVRHDRLYPNLSTLVESGLITRNRTAKDDIYYKTTEKGQRDIRARRAWENKHLKY